MVASFNFNPEKNDLLYEHRGITFPEIIEAIAENGVIKTIFPSRKYQYLIKEQK